MKTELMSVDSMGVVGIRGLPYVIKELERLGRGDVIRNEISPVMKRCAQRIQAKAKSIVEDVAFDTGALRDSIKVRHSRKNMSAKVVATYPKARKIKGKRGLASEDQKRYYAFAIEYGTKKRYQTPFLHPAARACMGENDADMKEAMRKALPDVPK